MIIATKLDNMMPVEEFEIEVNKKPHIVKFEYSYLALRRKIWVDGKLIHQTKYLFEYLGGRLFEIDDVPSAIYILTLPIPFAIQIELIVDGISQTSGKPIKFPIQVPVWAMIFVVINLIPPLLLMVFVTHPSVLGIGLLTLLLMLPTCYVLLMLLTIHSNPHLSKRVHLLTNIAWTIGWYTFAILVSLL